MSTSSDLSCPSCGVAVEGVSAHTRSLQCPHCANWVYLSGNGWTSAGLFEHAIDAPSMLRIGRRGTLVQTGDAPRPFVVAGRIRVTYSQGSWDEWWLEFEDANHQWLEEDDGSYQLHSTENTTPDNTAVLAAKAGASLRVGADSWFVTERIDAEVAGVEGTLPVATQPNEKMVCVDAIGNGREFSIEASGLDINITHSQAIPASALVWD